MRQTPVEVVRDLVYFKLMKKDLIKGDCGPFMIDAEDGLELLRSYPDGVIPISRMPEMRITGKTRIEIGPDDELQIRTRIYRGPDGSEIELKFREGDCPIKIGFAGGELYGFSI